MKQSFILQLTMWFAELEQPQKRVRITHCTGQALHWPVWEMPS